MRTFTLNSRFLSQVVARKSVGLFSETCTREQILAANALLTAQPALEPSPSRQESSSSQESISTQWPDLTNNTAVIVVIYRKAQCTWHILESVNECTEFFDKHPASSDEFRRWFHTANLNALMSYIQENNPESSTSVSDLMFLPRMTNQLSTSPETKRFSPEPRRNNTNSPGIASPRNSPSTPSSSWPPNTTPPSSDLNKRPRAGTSPFQPIKNLSGEQTPVLSIQIPPSNERTPLLRPVTESSSPDLEKKEIKKTACCLLL